MKTITIGIMTLFLLSFSWGAQASYLTFPGKTGITYPEASSGCWTGLSGGGMKATAGSICYLTFPIPVESGKTLSSITLYFYDNSGSQGISTSLRRMTLSATGGTTELASGSDTTTSSSSQFLTLSYGSTTSSSYVYFLNVTLSSETELRGIKIYYY